MKRLLTAVLAAVLAFGLTACGKSGSGAGSVAGNGIESGKLPSASQPVNQTESAAPGSEETPELASLRESITGSGADIGVAYLGYAGELGSMDDAAEMLQNGAYAEDYPFLLTLPDDAFVNGGGDELYAFVPASGSDALTVYAAELTDSGSYRNTGAPLCRGKAGEVLLVRCNVSDIIRNVCVETAGKQFYPALSLMDGSVCMDGSYFDFTLYEALWGFSGGEGDGLLSDDEADIRRAAELLCETDEVRFYMDLGMSVQYTGEHEIVDGRECWLFALGTERDDQFVREIFYAVCDNLVYVYDTLDDSWQALGAG